MVKASYSYDPQFEGVESTPINTPHIGDAKPANETPTNAYIIDEPKTQASSKSKLGDAATVVAGGAIALVGVPMLILPGPGLLAVGGGIALMAKGAKGLLSKKN
ncbi:MAG: hypothetical protein ACOYD7_00990 [Raoultibacter sp.]|jgi:hypothetical protein